MGLLIWVTVRRHILPNISSYLLTVLLNALEKSGKTLNSNWPNQWQDKKLRKDS